MIYDEVSISNMVAGKGSGLGRTFGVPDFDENDFDGWVVYLKAFLMKFDRSDVALTTPMPLRATDRDGVEEMYDDDQLEAKFQRSKEK